MPGSVKELYLCWSLYKQRRRNVIWEVAPLDIFWTIWRERKRRAFENVELSIPDLKKSVLSTMFFWCTETAESKFNSFVEFVDSFSVN